MTPELFLSCDWGTSRFRLRLAEMASGSPLAEFTSGAGVAKIAAETPPAARAEVYRQVLLDGVATLQKSVTQNLAGLPVMISGMASSSLGWCELAYAKIPFALSGNNIVCQELAGVEYSGIGSRVFLISGVCSDDDVMRGEETELLGAWRWAQSQEFDRNGIVILPGTHSKHLEVRDDTLVGIRTYMTGELFDVLGKQSVLRHSLPQQQPGRENTGPAKIDEVLPSDESFAHGVLAGSRRSLSHALFLVRTRSLLAGMAPADCAAFLSGILIGAELKDLTGSSLSDRPVLLCASGDIAIRYNMAFASLSLTQRVVTMPVDEVNQLATRGQSLMLNKLLGC